MDYAYFTNLAYLVVFVVEFFFYLFKEGGELEANKIL